MSHSQLIRSHLPEALSRGYIAAFRILGSSDESQEACQEAALKALAASDSYEPSRPFYPWFYRILKNHCMDRLRQRKRVSVKSEVEVVEPRASVESELISHQRADAVSEAMEKLSDEHREIVELRHFQDLSYEEIAELLGCPVGTVMSRLYRARKALRAALLKDPRFDQETQQREVSR